MKYEYEYDCDSNIRLNREQYKNLKEILISILNSNLKDDWGELTSHEMVWLDSKEFKLHPKKTKLIQNVIGQIIHLEQTDEAASIMASEMAKEIDKDILKKVFDEATYNETNKQFAQELKNKPKELSSEVIESLCRGNSTI